MADLLREWCEGCLALVVAGIATSGRAAVEQIIATAPDLILFDSHISGLNGYHVLAHLKATMRNLRAIVITEYCNLWNAYCAERGCVSGLICKERGGIADLKKAISEVLVGRRFFAEPFRQILKVNHANPGSFDKVLSPWQITLLEHIGAAWSNDEIARKFKASVSSIERQRSLIRSALGFNTARELMNFARTNGFAESVGEPVSTT